MALPSEPVARPRLRGRLHAVATVLSLGALVLLVRSATSIEASLAAWIYGLAAVLCYLTSSTYHVAARSERARALWRRADHSMIYVLIAGTFTPVCLLGMAGWWRWILLVIVWLGAALGVGLAASPRPRLPRFRIALYLILGWAGMAAMPSLIAHRPFGAALVVLAGVLYTVGAVLFGRRRPALRPAWFGYHEFWHSMGIAAGALLFVVNLNLIAVPV
jgi:hemolysin III